MKYVEKFFFTHTIQIPPTVIIQKKGNSLFFEGPLGFIEIDMCKIDSLGLGFYHINMEFNQMTIFVKKTSKNSKAFFGSLLSLYQNNIHGVCQGFLVYLELVGVGFRAILHESKNIQLNGARLRGHSPGGQGAWGSAARSSSSTHFAGQSPGRTPSREASPPQAFVRPLKTLSAEYTFPSIQKIELKVGQSHEIMYEIPQNIRAFSLKPTLICLYGLDKMQITQVASDIRNYRPPEPYKGKGIRYKDEIIQIKVGKKK